MFLHEISLGNPYGCYILASCFLDKKTIRLILYLTSIYVSKSVWLPTMNKALKLLTVSQGGRDANK